MTRTELQNDINKNLEYLGSNTPPDYQEHLQTLNDAELFSLWIHIHNAREAKSWVMQ